MSPEPGPAVIHTLLAHDAFLRALTRSLPRGDNRAEDVVQDTWIVALRKAPRDASALRSWLAGIGGNLSRLLRRKDAEAAERLPAVTAPEGEPSPREIVAREEARRRVVRALLGLDPAHRSPLVLRYYEDLSYREIARRLGLPVETVRTRLRRGRERLRAHLDRAYGGDRRSWALLLLPRFRRGLWGRTALGAISSLSGGLAVKTKAALAIGAIALLAFLAGLPAIGAGGIRPARGRAKTRWRPSPASPVRSDLPMVHLAFRQE